VAPILRAFLVPVASEHRNLVEEFSASHAILHEVQVGPHPQSHVVKIGIQGSFLDGQGSAVGHELRADRIAVVVHDLASRGPQSIDAHQGVAIIDEAIPAFDPRAVAEIFDPDCSRLFSSVMSAFSAAGLEFDRQQIAAMHDDVGISEMILKFCAEVKRSNVFAQTRHPSESAVWGNGVLF